MGMEKQNNLSVLKENTEIEALTQLFKVLSDPTRMRILLLISLQEKCVNEVADPKRVFTYEMLMDLIWQEDYNFYSRKAINNHVTNLRKKLKVAPDIPNYIKSVYGVGYKFNF